MYCVTTLSATEEWFSEVFWISLASTKRMRRASLSTRRQRVGNIKRTPRGIPLCRQEQGRCLMGKPSRTGSGQPDPLGGPLFRRI